MLIVVVANESSPPSISYWLAKILATVLARIFFPITITHRHHDTFRQRILQQQYTALQRINTLFNSTFYADSIFEGLAVVFASDFTQRGREYKRHKMGWPRCVPLQFVSYTAATTTIHEIMAKRIGEYINMKGLRAIRAWWPCALMPRSPLVAYYFWLALHHYEEERLMLCSMHYIPLEASK